MAEVGDWSCLKAQPPGCYSICLPHSPPIVRPSPVFVLLYGHGSFVAIPPVPTSCWGAIVLEADRASLAFLWLGAKACPVRPRESRKSGNPCFGKAYRLAKPGVTNAVQCQDECHSHSALMPNRSRSH